MKIQDVEKALKKLEKEGMKIKECNLSGGTDRLDDFVGEIRLKLKIEGKK